MLQSENGLDLGVRQGGILVPFLPLKSCVILVMFLTSRGLGFLPYSTGVKNLLQGYCEDYRYCVYSSLNSVGPLKSTQ